MNKLNGGEATRPGKCNCACKYVNQGGSNTVDNGWANQARGITGEGDMFIVLPEVVIRPDGNIDYKP